MAVYMRKSTKRKHHQRVRVFLPFRNMSKCELTKLCTRGVGDGGTFLCTRGVGDGGTFQMSQVRELKAQCNWNLLRIITMFAYIIINPM